MHKNLFTSNLAEIKVAYSTNVKFRDMAKIRNSGDCESMLRKIWSSHLELREEFYLLLLNRANKVIGWHCISQGGISSTVVDIRLIFSIALKCVACGIIVAHNHPSGNLLPSESDISLTKKIKEAGKLFDISLLDHIILTNEGYYSFADVGIL
ncbi:MAG: JAB domain-containing protein [Bacteroidetes bacterium]|nr:JAB domain-containing protein [Bacteroidota bacterium]MBK9672792.1 JAB domain-containing protein [Bacteroidota bacterium]MBK9800907.1 JAB domain-containing protein [Bacteroidota bacterium]MBP6412459.1 JAB domain-containing protein [Bacteroidia bacterium]